MRRQGYSPEEAQDLTQGFFELLLERKDLDAVRQEKGRLRSYLLTSLKNFIGKAHRREMTIKRGEGRALVPLEELLARERADLELADTLSPERIYERRWALILLEQVLARLGEEYRAAGRAPLFEKLKQTLTDEPGRPSQAEIALGIEHERKCGEAGVLSTASAIPVVVARGDRSHRRSPRRRGRRVATFHRCIASVRHELHEFSQTS